MAVRVGASRHPWLAIALASWNSCGAIRADDAIPAPAARVADGMTARPASAPAPSIRPRADRATIGPVTDAAQADRPARKSRLRRLLDRSVQRVQAAGGEPAGRASSVGEGTPPAILQPGTPSAP